MADKNYIVNSTSISVVGHIRSIVYDLPKKNYELIPNSVSEFLKTLRKKTFSEIYNDTPSEYRDTLTEYLNFCLEKEYILEIPSEISKKSFPELNLKYESPYLISNLVIELDNTSIINDGKIKTILTLIKCYNIQIIFGKDFDYENISIILKSICDVGLRSIELIMAFKIDFDYEYFTKSFKNISFIFLYSAPTKGFIKKHFLGLQQIFTSINKFEISYYKSSDFFNVDINLFTESQNYHTYYNGKLFIDANGNIKNSSLSKKVFGNINSFKKQDEILKIIYGIEFQKYWKIHKGLIDICKDCEFRHMCVDNRVPLKRNENEWYHQLECNYNPYIAKWENEDGYRKLDECGVQSNEKGIKIDLKKLNAINKKIWGDD